jgi:hypothetical protein
LATSHSVKKSEKVIAIAGMCVGWPAEEGGITPRLPFGLTR